MSLLLLVSRRFCEETAHLLKSVSYYSRVGRSKWRWLNELLGHRGGVLQLIKGNLESQELLLLGQASVLITMTM